MKVLTVNRLQEKTTLLGTTICLLVTRFCRKFFHGSLQLVQGRTVNASIPEYHAMGLLSQFFVLVGIGLALGGVQPGAQISSTPLYLQNRSGVSREPQRVDAGFAEASEEANTSSSQQAGGGGAGFWMWRLTWLYTGVFDSVTGLGGYVGAGEWWQGGWFSNGEQLGRLRSEGGWLLYFLDVTGLQMFGRCWPFIAWSLLLAIEAAILAVLTHSISSLLAPVRFVVRLVSPWCNCRKISEATRDAAKLLPTPSRVLTSIVWHGPARGCSTTTDFYQTHVKGRGSKRKQNDLVVRIGGEVARLTMDPSQHKKIDKKGLGVTYTIFKGATSRKIKKELEGRERARIHLCRHTVCDEADGCVHVKEYAAVDAEAIVDLGQYSRISTYRMGVLALRTWFFFLRICLVFTGGCLGCCGRRKRSSKVAPTSTSYLDQESESESEVEESPCQAVRVGVRVGHEMRPLAPEGCRECAGVSTQLLEEDAQVSDIDDAGKGGNVVVKLCSHHDQVYRAARHAHKCSVVTCYKQVAGALDGVPVCAAHLVDRQEGPRATRSRSRSREGSTRVQTARVERPPSREASREPPPQHETKDALLRVALQVAGKKVWYVLLAKIHGGSSAGEKYELDVPDLGVTFWVKKDRAGRLEEEATMQDVRDLLTHPPAGYDDLGAPVHATVVPRKLHEALGDWHRRSVGGGGGALSRLSDRSWRQAEDDLAAQPEHAWGGLTTEEGGRFGPTVQGDWSQLQGLPRPDDILLPSPTSHEAKRSRTPTRQNPTRSRSVTPQR